MSNENEKVYNVTVHLPHTCNDEEWKKECIAEGFGTECVACKNEIKEERSFDVS